MAGIGRFRQLGMGFGIGVTLLSRVRAGLMQQCPGYPLRACYSRAWGWVISSHFSLSHCSHMAESQATVSLTAAFALTPRFDAL